jgi:hypothetical protein
MRLFGVTMVRNESDIIEASVRHNLSILDGLTVIDHGSVDGTSEILAALQRERLNLRVLRDDSAGFYQAERLTAAARDALAREGADFVFPIDADEFIKTSSRDRLEEALAQVPPAEHAVAHWLTYVPEFRDSEERAVGASHLRRRLAIERHGSHKSVIGRAFMQPTQYLVSGNHLVDDAAQDKPPRHLRLDREAVALAHCPVRSAAQLERKIVLGYLAHLETKPDNDRQAFHWRDLYEDILAGTGFTPERLAEIACNYGLPRERWQPAASVALVDDPVPLRAELRYAAKMDLQPLWPSFPEGKRPRAA